MRNYFFDKGQQVKTPIGEFILAYNKLDSHNYALERLENCNNNYVYDVYSSFEDNHFLRYITCWEEEETVVKKIQKVQKEENVQKSSKKKSMGLGVFLSKKKAESESQSRGEQLFGKSKKDVIQQKQQQIIKVKVTYVQLQCFQRISVPKDVSQIKISMAIIYLLAQAVNKANGIWPKMIPVLTNQGFFKFVKKGGERDLQLIALFNFAMTDRKIEEWSQQMSSIYLQYKKSGQIQMLSAQINKDLQLIYKAEYDIVLSVEGKKIPQKAKIVQPQRLGLIYSGYEIPLNEFKIIFSYIDENTREVTLQHTIQNSIILIGESSNFILRYFKTFRTK